MKKAREKNSQLVRTKEILSPTGAGIHKACLHKKSELKTDSF
jgi:hypothetical protein